MFSRRQALSALGVGCAAAALPRFASATLARAVTLPELVGLSRFALVGSGTSAHSRWETLGGARRIVTYVELEVMQPIDGRPPPEPTLLVRTLGGRVGDIGQLVHGEARFELGAPAVVFVGDDEDGVLGVTAMAQGHYPLRADSGEVLRLRASPNVPALLRVEGAAVERLARRTVVEAEALVSEIMRSR